MSKGYTINFFLETIGNVSGVKLARNNVYSIVSPRLGANSVKASALDNFLGGRGSALKIANGVGRFAKLGRTPRARLLKALRLRKTNGAI